MRDKCKLPNDLNQEPPIFKHLNICAIPEEVWEVYRKLGKKTLLKPPAPVRDLTKLTIFVDGSCTDPTIALVRISSGATSNELPTFPSLKKRTRKKIALLRGCSFVPYIHLRKLTPPQMVHLGISQIFFWYLKFGGFTEN